MPLQETMCATCPFRKGSKYAYLVPAIAHSALTEAGRICHSTGENDLRGATGKPEALCRGARDLQLHYLHATGFLASPTDRAWTNKCKEMGIEQDAGRRRT
jgi:hypothetical protein